MFPTVNTPISDRLRRGIDLAVQFATLGEYRAPGAPSVAELPPPAPGTAARIAPPPPPLAAGTPARFATPPPRVARAGRSRARHQPERAPEFAGRPAETVRPATAAARRRTPRPAAGSAARTVPAQPPRRVSTRAAVRSMALRTTPGAQARPRSRVGQPVPRPQPCVSPVRVS